MKHFGSSAVLACCFAALVAWGGGSQTADGPYIIVDQAAPEAWGHVFGTLPAAIAYINTRPNVEEMAGATIIMYPGVYTTAATIVVNVEGLRITTSNGADRTILKAADPFTGASVLSVTAPGVLIQDVTIQDVTTTGVLNGINVSGRECTLQRLLLSDVATHGIEVSAGADQLVVDTVESMGSGTNGIVVGPAGGPVWDTTILNSTFRSNGADGISLVAARRVAVLRSSCLGNFGNGITIAAACSRVEISQCEISSNGATGVFAAGTAQLSLGQNTFRGNTAAILLTSTGSAMVADNSFSQNLGPAVSLAGACTDVVVQDNTIMAQAGTPLPVTAVIIGGTSNNCTVQGNSIDGYHHAIQLVALSLPRGNIIQSNSISNSISDGIWVCASGGLNTFSQNNVSKCGGHGIHVQAAASDEYVGNQVTDCTLSGIAVDDGSAVVSDLTIERNSLSGCGQDGITVFDILNADSMSSILIFGNRIEGNDKIGLSVNSDPSGIGTNATANLRIEANTILSNEGGGVSFSAAPGCLIAENVVADCLGTGITGAHAIGTTQIRRNSIHNNDGGGVSLGLAGLVGAVVEENAIFDNQGYGVTIARAPVGPYPLPLPYPFGVSLGLNWWGSPTGPAGFFSGTGNAVLGVPAEATNAIAPVLPALVFATYTADAEVLESAQVAVIPSFAATEVKVNRLDTSGVRLVFSDVEPRARGLANTALYTSTALSEYLPASGGQILRAVAVLLAGFDTGTVEVSLAYDPEQLAGGSPEDISVLALTGGVWAFDASAGSWRLEGAVWRTLSGCPVPGASLTAVEIPVSHLRGEYLAVALVLSAPSE